MVCTRSIHGFHLRISLFAVGACACASDAGEGGTEGASETTDASPTSDASGVTSTESTSSGATETETTWPGNPDCVNMDKAPGELCYAEGVFPIPSAKVSFGDFDGDGHLDAAVVVEDTPDRLALCSGNANATFDAPIDFAFADDPSNGDDPLSLGVVRVRPAASADWLFVQGSYGSFGAVTADLWWSRGTPSLARFAQPSATPDSGPYVGDFDGDGASDLVFAVAGTDLSSLELHSCDATDCGPPVPASVSGAPPSPPYTVVTGDVNNDGRDDLVALSRTAEAGGTASRAHVMTSTGSGFATAAPVELGGGLSGFRIMLQEATGDANTDLLVVGDTGDSQSNTATAVLHVFPGDGTGNFGAAAKTDFGTNLTGLAVADVNHDGVPDLAIRVGDLPYLGIARGQGGGTFGGGPVLELSAAPTGLTGQPVPIWATAVDDLDGDGELDIVSVVQTGNTSWALSVLLAVP